MDLLYFSMILLYWLFLAGVVFLSGAFTSRILVTGPSGADTSLVCKDTGKSFGKIASEILLIVAILTFLTNAIHFVLHCSVMTETPLNEILSVLSAFATKTKYGRLTIIRTILLAAIIATSFIIIKNDNKISTLTGALFSLALLIVIAMSGHQGVKGYMNSHFFVDSLHLVAVSAWIGGLFFIRICVSLLIKGDKIEFWSNLTSLINRYSTLATYCVGITVVTGIALIYFNVKGYAVFVQTQYGIILLLKMVLVGIIMVLGGINKFFIIPALNKTDIGKRTEGTEHEKILLHLVTAEATIGVVVLFLTSLLTHLSPESYF